MLPFGTSKRTRRPWPQRRTRVRTLSRARGRLRGTSKHAISPLKGALDKRRGTRHRNFSLTQGTAASAAALAQSTFWGGSQEYILPNVDYLLTDLHMPITALLN